MADPKYAGLPGIAVDQPDIYETNSLPEDDQPIQDYEEFEYENIESLKLNPKDAYSNFKGKSILASSIDFSDRISHSKRTGYGADSTEYEMLGAGDSVKETPQQKYQRLQHEIRELQEDLNQLQKSVKEESDSDKSSPVILAKQVTYLQNQLVDLHLEKIIGPHIITDVSDPQGALHKRLMTQLETFKHSLSTTASSKKGKTTDSTQSDHVLYEVYCRPEQAKFSVTAKTAELEQRLERLEAVIGHDPEKLSILTCETSDKSLVAAVALLNSKTALLDPAIIDQVEGRLVALNQKLSEITQKKTEIEDADKQNKVSELYNLIRKWEGTCIMLPSIIERMVALKNLHEQALQFSAALSHLDTIQQQIVTNLKNNQTLLKEVQDTFNKNVNAIQENCASLDKRLQVLK